MEHSRAFVTGNIRTLSFLHEVISRDLPTFSAVGGLIGENGGNISHSYAVVNGDILAELSFLHPTASSSGFASAGGLVGENAGVISSAYAVVRGGIIAREHYTAQ